MELLKKLQIKDESISKLIINPYNDYINQLKEAGLNYDTEPKKEKYQFIQLFGTSNQELKELGTKYLPYLIEDGLLWLCYPKKSSKKVQSDCSRDTVIHLLETFNFGPVRQISLDDDFSALRFRNEKLINRR